MIVVPSSKQKGFTLLEVLLVMAILVIFASAGSALYWSFFKKTELDSVAQVLRFDMRRARAQAVSGINDKNWGVRFVNTSTSYYEIYATPTTYADVSTTVESVEYLPKGIVFLEPSIGNTQEVLFDKITGSVDVSSSIKVFSPVTDKSISFTINTLGIVE